MPRFRPIAMLERSATADLFKNTLSRIPSLFGRLAYLASLRDPNSGTYRHHGLAIVFGREESKKALRESHNRVFREWLTLGLEEKQADLREYLQSLDDPRPEVLRHWSLSRLYRTYAPASARKGEKDLFSEELDLLVETFNCEGAGGGPGPDSSQSE